MNCRYKVNGYSSTVVQISVDSHDIAKVRYMYLLNTNVIVATETRFTELYLCDTVCEKFRIAPSVR